MGRVSELASGIDQQRRMLLDHLIIEGAVVGEQNDRIIGCERVRRDRHGREIESMLAHFGEGFPVGIGIIHMGAAVAQPRSEEHTSELQSLMRISYAVFCLKKKKHINTKSNDQQKLNINRTHK